MPLLKTEAVAVKVENDIVIIRKTVRKWAIELRFGLIDQTKLVTAASELARNMLRYGGGGEVRLEALSEGPKTGLRLTFEDQGPGIPDLEAALRDGYTTGDGLGLGLGGSKRLSNEFAIKSTVGHGTTVAIARWRQP